MNTWLRKEDLWIPVIVLVFCFIGFLFWCVSNTTDDRGRDCRMKGGTLVYLQYGGWKCLKEL